MSFNDSEYYQCCSSHLKEILRFSTSKNKYKLSRQEVIDNALQSLKNMHSELEGEKVWVLVGKKEDSYICLQVGQGVNIKKEFKDDLVYMKKEYSVKETRPYRTILGIDHSLPKGIEKRKFIYSKMFDDYEELIFYTLDIDEYLRLDTAIKDPLIALIVSKSKRYLAEALFAYRSNSVYWDAFRSGMDMVFLNEILQPTINFNQTTCCCCEKTSEKLTFTLLKTVET